jgi:hypothetical protein
MAYAETSRFLESGEGRAETLPVETEASVTPLS